MKYQYKIKNFRVFDEEGANLDMAPITILTGCNSSGKSSFVKSMLLVNNVLKELSRDGKLRAGIKLDFTEKPNNLLGTFGNVIHRGSKSKNITAEYTVPSVLLNEDVVVAMTFRSHKKLYGGLLNEITISRKDGSKLFQAKLDENNGSNTTLCADLRNPFFRYVFARNNQTLLKKAKKATESREPYYYANKEWIDKILLSNNMWNLVPHIKSHSDGWNDDDIDITNEQIYKENLLYNTILESLFEATKDNFESLAKSIADRVINSDVYDITLRYIDSVAKHFKDSEFEKFSDYFNHLYNGFFCNEIDPYEVVAWGTYESLSGYNRLTGQAISADMLKDFCGIDSLGDLYNLIKLLTGLTSSKNFSEIYSIEKPNWYTTYFDYVNLVIREILSYRIPTEIRYIPTSIVNIKRLYSFDNKDGMTELLKDYILSEPEYEAKGKHQFTNDWLKKLNIGKKVSVTALADGTGCAVRIYKENDKKGQLLADFGYGVSQLIFLLLRIEIEANRHYPIINGSSKMDWEKKDERNFCSQFEKPLTIVLEEPEVHLHPKMQSAIADILLDAYNSFNFHFIVETHSEYLIRRTQAMIATDAIQFENNPFRVYYFPENGVPYDMVYQQSGMFENKFDEGFFDEASKQQFSVIKKAREIQHV